MLRKKSEFRFLIADNLSALAFYIFGDLAKEMVLKFLEAARPEEGYILGVDHTLTTPKPTALVRETNATKTQILP